MTQDLPGRVTALRSAQVRARVEGVLEKQLFADGSEVRAGTPLFQIDARTYRAAAAAAEAELLAQQAITKRYAPLLASKAVSQQEYDLAVAREKTAEATLARARQDLENSRVASPIAGRAGRALVTEGALVGRGEPTHLVTVEQLDPIRVEFTQPYADVLARKKLGGEVRRMEAPDEIGLVLEDGTPYAQTGRLKFNDLAVDPATGAVAMRAEFSNPKRELLPGTFVRVRLPVPRSDTTLSVPQRAVQTSTLGQSVLVIDKENILVSRSITTQGFVGSDYLVTAGLTAGERVAVNGAQKVRPGSTVTPVKPVPPPATEPAARSK